MRGISESRLRYKRARGICETPYCRNKAGKHRTVCYKCKSRRAKEINLVGYTFNALKQNAKRRGKEFTITLNYFKNFCKETDYLTKKGQKKTSLTVDRKDSKKGYVPGNIQALSLIQNSIKDCPF